MADTKISALTALTGAGVAVGDLATIVDVSDTTMAASGTNKSITAAELLVWLQNNGLPVRKQLGADLTLTTTLAEATGITQALGAGTWMFQYEAIYRSDTATVGCIFGVNFDGTQTTFVVQGSQFEATTAASTGAADQVHATFGLRSGGTGRAPSTTAAVVGSISVDTANADMQVEISGLVVVTVAGNLELWAAKEATGTGVQTLKAASSLVAIKVA